MASLAEDFVNDTVELKVWIQWNFAVRDSSTEMAIMTYKNCEI